MRIITLFFLVASIIACNSDKLPKPIATDACEVQQITYVGEIENIIVRTCAYDGCHSNGAAIGDYTSYDKLLSVLENGLFATRVLDIGDMPPIYAPDDRPKSLTEEEVELIECWFNTGFPEN
ncbi:MAG: hypothetical protein AAF738_00460 [Bacteroidota bacterium]